MANYSLFPFNRYVQVACRRPGRSFAVGKVAHGQLTLVSLYFRRKDNHVPE